MFKLLCVYLIFHLQCAKSDRPYPLRYCSNTLKPLMNIIGAQRRIAQSIAEQEQTPFEHMTPSIDITPCDLIRFRKSTAEDHNHYETEIDKHLKNPKLTIDPGCGCSYIQRHVWKPDEWTNFTQDKLQQQIQGYEMVTLTWARAPQEKCVFSHINPEYHFIRHIHAYYSQDLLAFVEYTIVSFVEKYQRVTWKLFFDDRRYPNQEIDTCYILLKDTPNVKTIENNNSTLSPIRTNNISECDPRHLVQIETINEYEASVRIPGGDFIMVLPNVNDHTQLHDQLYFKWYRKNNHGRNWIVIKIKYRLMRTKYAPSWWILQKLQTNLMFH